MFSTSKVSSNLSYRWTEEALAVGSETDRVLARADSAEGEPGAWAVPSAKATAASTSAATKTWRDTLPLEALYPRDAMAFAQRVSLLMVRPVGIARTYFA